MNGSMNVGRPWVKRPAVSSNAHPQRLRIAVRNCPKPHDCASAVEAGYCWGVIRQPPVELKLSIRDRPQVGKEDEVDYALVPQAAGLGSIRLVFGSVGEGLRVVNHGPSLAAVKPASGVPIFGSVTVQPVKAGLFTLTAAVAVESSTESVVVWPFTIPIIAGEGPAQTAANRP